VKTPGALPAFSRPRRTTGLGKNLARVSTDVPAGVKHDLEGKVRADGYDSTAEWLRDVCIAKARGVNTLRTVAEQRIASVSAIVPEKDRSG
jgi:hypothetical protein